MATQLNTRKGAHQKQGNRRNIKAKSMSLLTIVRLTTILLLFMLLPAATLLTNQQQQKEQQQLQHARLRRQNNPDQKFSLPAVPLPPPPPFPAAKHNFALNAFAIGEHSAGNGNGAVGGGGGGGVSGGSFSSSISSSSGCGGLLKSRYGLIQTPNFPHRFATPIECVWIIDASELPATAQGNVSIVVYLTQLYVLGGLKFTEYMYYSDDFKVPAHRVFTLTEEEVTQVTWLQFNSQYLEIRFTMATLDGTHLRALDRLLDVYGFNITYEVQHEVKASQCNTLQCRFLGDCYASADYR